MKRYTTPTVALRITDAGAAELLAAATGAMLSAKVDGSTIDFNSSGQLTALGGGEVTQKVVSLANNETLTLGNLTMKVKRKGIYFVTVRQQRDYDALLVNAVIPRQPSLNLSAGFEFQCVNNATKWIVNGIQAPDLISTRFDVPVIGGFVKIDDHSYNETYAVCVASSTTLNVRSFSASLNPFYMHPLTVVRYH